MDRDHGEYGSSEESVLHFLKIPSTLNPILATLSPELYTLSPKS